MKWKSWFKKKRYKIIDITIVKIYVNQGEEKEGHKNEKVALLECLTYGFHVFKIVLDGIIFKIKRCFKLCFVQLSSCILKSPIAYQEILSDFKVALLWFTQITCFGVLKLYLKISKIGDI